MAGEKSVAMLHVHDTEDCELSDCIGCGQTVPRCELNVELMCRECRGVESIPYRPEAWVHLLEGGGRLPAKGGPALPALFFACSPGGTSPAAAELDIRISCLPRLISHCDRAPRRFKVPSSKKHLYLASPLHLESPWAPPGAAGAVARPSSPTFHAYQSRAGEKIISYV